jgi:hypothetical protein
MYRTPKGERTLKGAEGELMRAALIAAVERVTESYPDDRWPLGVAAFDRLTTGQQLYLFDQVGRALLVEDAAPPPLLCSVDATVAALIQTIESNIRYELNFEDSHPGLFHHWRQLLLDVFTEAGETDDLPDATCVDFDEWDLLLEVLDAGLLFDADYEDEEFYVDGGPEANRAIRDRMGVDNEYFAWIAPDPRDDEALKIVAGLEQLTGRKFTCNFPRPPADDGD